MQIKSLFTIQDVTPFPLPDLLFVWNYEFILFFIILFMHRWGYLAVERNVAPATQDQAFNAILFFFRYVLDKDMGNLSDTVRAHKKQ